MFNPGLAQGPNQFEGLVVPFQTLFGRQGHQVIGNAQVDAKVDRCLTSSFRRSLPMANQEHP